MSRAVLLAEPEHQLKINCRTAGRKGGACVGLLRTAVQARPVQGGDMRHGSWENVRRWAPGMTSVGR